MCRATLQYRPKPRQDEGIRHRLKELAEVRRRFGYRRLHVMLKREGFHVNHKRIHRLYREEGLSLRRRRRKKTASVSRLELPKAAKPNQRLSMDFMSDSLSDGRKIRLLTIVDDFTRECPAIEVDTSISGLRVVQTLTRIAQRQGLPEAIVIDNGPEFIGKALDEWAYRRGIKLYFIRPGKPSDNAYVESFNGKLRDECLNENWFLTLPQAREIIEAWRVDYNQTRPHSALGNLSPEAFAKTQQPHTAQESLIPVAN